MGNDNPAELIFSRAIELSDRRARGAYLEVACANNLSLRQEVESLVAAYETAGEFLEHPEAVLASGRPASDPGLAGPQSGERIGRYRLLEKVGEGAFGEVWRAEQEEPVRRLVALKVLKAGMDTRQVVARFEAERQALALMDHPHIAKVFDGGVAENGRPFFVMELVSGIPLTRYCDEQRLTLRRRLELFVKVCQAVQHAHQKGVIHRDLKPSNVLVLLEAGEPSPKVIDFGIAKATAQPLTDKTLVTHVLQLVGTPAYMSPEQAELTNSDIDTRTDVYSLGALLYEILVGQTPFAETGRTLALDELLRRIRNTEITAPSARLVALRPPELQEVARRRSDEASHLCYCVRGELDWVTQKAMEKDREQRYESAEALASDVRAYLADEPIQAGPPSTWYRWRKLARRRRRLVLTAAAGLLMLVSGLVLTSLLALWANRQRQDAVVAQHAEVAQRLRAEQAHEALRQQIYVADLNLAQEALQNGQLARVRELLERHRPQPGMPDLRHWEWRYLWQQSASERQIVLPAYHRPIRSLDISPDGRWLAWGAEDGALKVWDLRAREEAAQLESGVGDPAIVAFSPRRNRLAASVRRGLVKVWTSPSTNATSDGSWTELAQLPEEGWVRALSFSPGGVELACLGDHRLVELWQWAQTNRLASNPIVPLRDPYKCKIAFSPNHPWLAVGETDGRIRLLELPSLRERLQFAATREGVTALAFSPDGRTLASGSGYNDLAIRLWEPATGGLVKELRGHTGWVIALSFSPDGTMLASAATDQTIRLWDARTWQELTVLRGHRHEVWAIAFSPDSRLLASGSRAGEIFLWDLSRPAGRAPRLEVTGENFRDISFAPDGQRFAVWHWDGAVTLRSVAEPTQSRRLSELGTNNYGALFSPNGRHVAVGTRSGSVRLLDGTTLAGAGMLLGREDGRMRPVGFTADGKRLLAEARLSPDARCYWWDVDTRKLLGSWSVGPVNHRVAVSPVGDLVVTGDFDGSVRFWDLMEFRELGRAEAHRTEVVGLAFSGDGQWVASGSGYGDIVIWNARTRAPQLKLQSPAGAIYSLAFSGDGRRLVLGGNWQQAVQLWDVASAQIIATLPAQGAMHETMRFAPNGNELATVNSDGTFQLWRAPALGEIDPPSAANGQGRP
jgi:WD40 repeat protein/serine/threonine protein kinase